MVLKSTNQVVEYYKEYSTFSGADIKAYIPFLDENRNAKVIFFAELQTLTYSTHRATKNIYGLGKNNPLGIVQGRRTIAGSMVFYKFHMNAIDAIFKSMNITQNSSKYLLLDQLPPFNISIIISNEYGVRRYVGIYGVKILTEGLVMSIQDLTSETTCQYIAVDIEPMREFKKGEIIKETNNEIVETYSSIYNFTYQTTALNLVNVLDNEYIASQKRTNPVIEAKKIINNM